MNKNLKVGMYGLLTWLIPFATGFLFYSKEGTLVIDIFLFKSIMIVEGGLVGAYLLLKIFRLIDKDFVAEGMKIGAIWFLINIILDMLILMPMAKMPFSVYFAEIGIRYLLIPIMSTMLGKGIANAKTL